MAVTLKASAPLGREVARDLDAIRLGLGRQLGAIRRQAADLIATQAKGMTPYGPGPRPNARNPNDRLPHLRDTISGRTSGVFSTHPAALVHEYGGVIRPHGGDIRIRPAHMAERAGESQRANVERLMAREVQRLIDQS